MNKKKVLVDTAFFSKLSKDNIKVFKKILSELNYIPIVHTYLANNELDVNSQFQNLVDEGYIEVLQYNDFLEDASDKANYEEDFKNIHHKLYEYLKFSKNTKKQLDKLVIPDGRTVFNYRKAQLSLGDVHMIIAAFYIGIPIILTEDADIDILRIIAKERYERNMYRLEIYNTVDLIFKIAEKTDTNFEKKELEQILKNIGEKKHCSKMKTIWNNNH